MKKVLNRYTGAPARLGIAVLAIASCTTALAADDGWYLGANIGRSYADIDNADIVANMLQQGFTTTSLTDYEEHKGYKIFSGYQVNENFAMEAGYFHLGEFGYMMELDPVATRRGDARMMGLNFDLVGLLPLTDKLQGFGKIGSIYGQSREQFSGHGPVTITTFDNHERELSYSYGLGMQYDMTPKLGIRLEAQRFRIDNTVLRNENVEFYSAGIVYRLGKKAQILASTTQPAPTAAAEARPPAATPPAAPTPMQVTLSADALFDFDSTAVKPAGRTELDKLANDLRGVDFDVIIVTGHTDRIGSQEYNLGLSERRAEAVKAYLVQNANITANKVTTRGVNGAEPVTRPGQCSGMAAAAQIACLEPDRRVEVEVTGTKPR